MTRDLGAVVVDTGVFAANLQEVTTDLVELYEMDTKRKRLLISFQTAAEIRYGAANASWGRRRIAEMEQRLAVAVTVPPADALVREWANLRVECQRVGHSFHEKVHVADLRIAATATLLDLRLVTHDAGFRGVPGLEVICHV
ncbi:MAG: PIN domain-containing protein [Acidimicrobiia bacterium]